jgi:hypothetical protein
MGDAGWVGFGRKWIGIYRANAEINQRKRQNGLNASGLARLEQVSKGGIFKGKEMGHKGVWAEFKERKNIGRGIRNSN